MMHGATATAQSPTPADPHAGHGVATAAQPPVNETSVPEGRWRVDLDANAFVGYNYQRREFTDFDVVESQNWFMAAAGRRWGSSTLTLVSMFSLEPFTMHDLGSPQVFQTGETFEGAPLIDYQHPHDLIMTLGGRYERTSGRLRTMFEASLVGTPALGPPPFMHRPSAEDNPQVPLSHHGLDSTHISSDVLTGGVGWKGLALEASWFYGREPDENRTDLDLGVPDSWAARLSWSSGPWRVQASGGRLEQPETVHPYDETRLSASVGYEGAVRRRPVAMLLAWGQKREVFGIFDNYLLEAHVALGARDALFMRAESVTKAILGGGVHPPGFQHYHPHSRVGAFTAGYVRDFVSGGWGRLGVGGDITTYHVPSNLAENYGNPLSFHVFLRYALKPGSAPHVHH
jgi:hypothetical protein